MAIFIVENSGKVGYGIKKYICKTMADIPVEVDGEEIAPGSRIYVSDEKKTYMLDTAGQWVEITESSGGGGGASSIDELSDVTITSPQEGQVLAYDETTDTWNNVANSAANKMDKINPTGTGSLSLNRKPNTIVGEKSVAEGNNTTASGLNSHAEGSGSTASGGFSHAEGLGSTASGLGSHAEGYDTAASGDYSHTEGNGTIASNRESHAEGNQSKATGECSHAEGASTTASGNFSHAEGRATKAIGTGSHAEGNGTNATHYAQHVFGIFNELDGSANPYSQKGNYVEIVGNGTADNARSNARTLDWNGNEVLAGDLTINGNQSVTQALGKIVIQKTQAEYDLLTSAEKNNGSIYKITDKAKIYCLDEEYHAVKEITSADYALLTSDEKNNGTLYILTDEETTADDISYTTGVSVGDKLDDLSKNACSGLVDLSSYLEELGLKYIAPTDGYLRVSADNLTSGYVRAIVKFSNGTPGPYLYMNITGSYQYQSLFIKKGMQISIAGYTQGSSMVFMPLDS